MEDRLLLTSSENISKLLSLLITHENNIKHRMRNRDRDNLIDIQFIIGRRNDANNEQDETNDISNNYMDSSNNTSSSSNLSNSDLFHTNENVQYTTFHQIDRPNDTMCSITHDFFNMDDEVAVLKCGHFFKKAPFLVWSCRHDTCPVCRTAFR